ncbi:hypothetical protein LWX53_05765 [bacterium]|nr:hypothetical protein [bacterium]
MSTRTARGRAALILAAIFSLLAAPPAAAGTGGRFSLSYAVSLEGFGSALFGAGEYAEFALAAGWETRGGLGASLSARLLAPINPPDIGDSLVGLGAELSLGRLQRHPLAWMSPRSTALAPSVGIAAYFPLSGADSPRYVLEAEPIRLYSGYGYLALGSPSLVLDEFLAPAGWGLALFKFSYLLR